jgi:uncharacterized protein (DUF1697 family)
MGRYLALLRGINVGGKHLVPMKDLAELFRGAGCREVSTFIQSGNVLFTAEPEVAAGLPGRIAASIRDRFGISSPVILRRAEELTAVLRGNPFPEEALVHVAFLADLPDPRRVQALDPGRSPGDAFQVAGRDIYLRLNGGVSGTRFTNAWFDSQLDTVSTFRNWRTVVSLEGLLRA